jgi:hypothetical protein
MIAFDGFLKMGFPPEDQQGSRRMIKSVAIHEAGGETGLGQEYERSWSNLFEGMTGGNLLLDRPEGTNHSVCMGSVGTEGVRHSA